MKQDTKTEILNVAHGLTALKGFDAFSYRDIAEQVNIKTSSIHYYFPAKSDLAVALIERYTATLVNMLEGISTSKQGGFERIKSFFGTLCDISGQERNFCLCGMLSADIHAVTEEAKMKINRFFNLMEDWLEKELKSGIEDGSVHSSVRPKSAAREIAATIEGAMLIVRVKENSDYLQDVMGVILARIRA